MISRSEMQQLARAAKQGWPTPVERRQQALRDVQNILDDESTAVRVREAAVKTMAAMQAAGWAQNAEQAA